MKEVRSQFPCLIKRPEVHIPYKSGPETKNIMSSMQCALVVDECYKMFAFSRGSTPSRRS